MQVSWRSEQTRSTSSSPRLPVLTTHTVLPGAVNLWVLFPRTYFFLPGAFFRKTLFRRNQVASLMETKNFGRLLLGLFFGLPDSNNDFVPGRPGEKGPREFVFFRQSSLFFALRKPRA